ncbi:MAG: CehA/McbA family metallohydrolase [Myxococcota bacterium]
MGRSPTLALALVLLLTACEQEPEPQHSVQRRGAPNARFDIAEDLAEARGKPRHPADGLGRAWLEAAADGSGLSAQVGRPGRFTVIYEAGAAGVAKGGGVYLQIPYNWGWTLPQLVDPEGPGFTTVVTKVRGLRFEVEVADEWLVRVHFPDRPLRAGERIRFDYGVGAALANVDRFAEREARFFVAVDGDGDGWREWIEASPSLDVAPGPPARLVLHLPPTARSGEPFSLRAAVLAANGDTGVEFEGTLTLELPPGVEGPTEIRVPAGRGGVATPVSLRLPDRGVVRIRARGPDGLSAESNPCVVTPEARTLLFGDLHGHSNLSDGTGTPEDYYRYARDVAALDVVALTDHDHWGMPFLDETPASWERIERAARELHEPGRFVSLLGYEWTSWIWGHRHVLHFEDTGPLLSSADERFDTPPELWDGLRGRPALTFAHHSAGTPVAIDWRIPPDPELEPVTEVVSVHGSSESFDSPWPQGSMIMGNTVRAALRRGYRLGLIGSGDSHDGHPGLVHLATSGTGGLAGIYATERTREAVLEALRARRVYATNGRRIVLDATLDGQPMGSVLPAGHGGRLEVQVTAVDEIEVVELITRDGVVASHPGEGRRNLALEMELPELPAGSFVYVRVRQVDDGAAWSSPFFFE